ncbi:MAG: hypothetical protein RX318_02230 [bacterium]|nr:hypothetical protein [bacterium]
MEEQSFSGTGGPSRDQWAIISTNIAVALEEVRRYWFNDCVEYLRTLRDTEKEHSHIEITNTELGGNADLAIRAYQLWVVSNMLAEKKYIPPDEGQDFADILYLQVGGTKIHNCMSYFERYKKASGGEQMTLLCADVAGYITEVVVGVDVIDLLALDNFFTLVETTQIVLAHAFGDEKTLSEFRTNNKS